MCVEYPNIQDIMKYRFSFDKDNLKEKTIEKLKIGKDVSLALCEVGSWSSLPNKVSTGSRIEFRLVFHNGFTAYPYVHAHKALCQLFDMIGGQAVKPKT